MRLRMRNLRFIYLSKRMIVPRGKSQAAVTIIMITIMMVMGEENMGDKETMMRTTTKICPYLMHN